MTNELNLLNELRIGDIVGTTNRIVIATTKKSERIPGDCYAVWVTICHKEGEYHPYVVWDVIARPEGFAAEHGDYCSTLQQAIKHYKRRGGEA
jgi:hypothetical protein